MLISSSFLKSAFEKYKKDQKINKENYSTIQSSEAGISLAFSSFLLALAILFFILEFLLLFYSISLALRCTKPGPERIMHITLSIVFTLPYALFSAFFSKCAQKSLTNSDFFLVPKGEISQGYNSPSNLTGMSFI